MGKCKDLGQIAKAGCLCQSASIMTHFVQWLVCTVSNVVHGAAGMTW